MTEESKSPILKIIVAIAIVIVLAIVFSYVFFGIETAMTVFQVAAVVGFFAAIIGVFLGIVIYLTTKKRYDALEKRNTEIVNSCKRSKAPYRQEFCFRGDKYVGTRKIGNVIGFSFSVTEPIEKVTKNEKGDDELEVVDGSEQVIVFIAFGKSPLIGLGLKKPDLFCGVASDFHGGLEALSSHTIYLNGTTFGPKIHGCYYLSKHWGDTTLIDKTIKSDVYRYNLEEFMRESKGIFDSAVNLDQQFVKHKEVSNVENIPLQR